MGAGADEVELTLNWKGKTPTRYVQTSPCLPDLASEDCRPRVSCVCASSLAESSWLSFSPSLPTPTGWTLDVLGNPVDPLSVGSQFSFVLWGCRRPLHLGLAESQPVLLEAPRQDVEGIL